MTASDDFALGRKQAKHMLRCTGTREAIQYAKLILTLKKP